MIYDHITLFMIEMYYFVDALWHDTLKEELWLQYMDHMEKAYANSYLVKNSTQLQITFYLKEFLIDLQTWFAQTIQVDLYTHIASHGCQICKDCRITVCSQNNGQ